MEPLRKCKQLSSIVVSKRKSDVDLASTPKRSRICQIAKKTPMKRGISVNTLMPAFHKYELVWAYIRGFATWPGVIEEILSNGKYRIHFFGDYTRSDVTRKNITHFFEGFNQFAQNFGNVKLMKAVEEAKIFLFDSNKPNVCYVCYMLALKHHKH